MSDRPDDDGGARMAACRACGNRVARSARRCPACGAREPTSAEPEAPPPNHAPPDAEPAAPPARRGRQLLGLAVAALVGAVVAGVIVFALRPMSSPPPVERGQHAPAVVPETPRETPAAAPQAPMPSRSRGRTDWLFFFKPGDRLARMADDAPLGMVIRTEKAHAFADGTTGPAYLVQIPEGGQRFVDADELERGARIQ